MYGIYKNDFPVTAHLHRLADENGLFVTLPAILSAMLATRTSLLDCNGFVCANSQCHQDLSRIQMCLIAIPRTE
jgi:hypothetical protein